MLSTPESPAPSAVTGTWGSKSAAWLAFGSDGTVTGSDGCNPVNGRFTERDGVIHFTLGLTTLRACVGVSISFAGLSTAVVHGETLITRDRHHTEIATLCRP